MNDNSPILAHVFALSEKIKLNMVEERVVTFVTQPQLLEGLKDESQVENNEKEGSRGALPNSQH
jgi:hypothetical protein